MTVRVACPNPRCGASFGVAEDKLGQAGSCPECGTTLILTDSARAETVAYPDRVPTAGDIPARLGRYEVLRKLGEGGMGTVYLARDTQLDRHVALKVPQVPLRDRPEVLGRLYREARVAASFQHPNFCPIHEVGESEGWHYLAMAYVEGRTLAELIADGAPMPPRRAAAIARTLAQALREAHDRGIVHRDLKPSNVMINLRRELIIMDFGLARREGSDDPELTHSGVVLGSPHYMAPEQVRAERDAIGPATDVYALGVILYEMLAGRRPYVGAMSLVLGLIATSRPDPPSKHRPDLDPELESICLKAMAHDPADRFPSMAALVAALEGYLGRPGTPSPSPPGPAPAASRPSLLPAIEEIQLSPEPPEADRPRPASAYDTDDTGSAYHLATVAEPDLAETTADDDPWAGVPFDAPPPRKVAAKPSRSAARPPAAQRPEGGSWRLLADISYVLVCIAALAGILALLAYWATTGRGTIQVQPPGSTVVRIDGQVIPPEALSRPIELRVGEHELLATQGDRIVASQKFQVDPGPNPPLRVRPDPRPPARR
jgi:serine/threonine protein kinase